MPSVSTYAPQQRKKYSNPIIQDACVFNRFILEKFTAFDVLQSPIPTNQLKTTKTLNLKTFQKNKLLFSEC